MGIRMGEDGACHTQNGGSHPGQYPFYDIDEAASGQGRRTQLARGRWNPKWDMDYKDCKGVAQGHYEVR